MGVRLAAVAAHANVGLEVLDISPFEGASLSQIAAVQKAISSNSASRAAAEAEEYAAEAAAKKAAVDLFTSNAAAALAARDPAAEWRFSEYDYRLVLSLEEDNVRLVAEFKDMSARKHAEKERWDRQKAEESVKVREGK